MSMNQPLRQKLFLTLVLLGYTPFLFANDQVLNQKIEIIQRIPPEYPTLALMKRVEGWVKVMFTISKEGDVSDVVVVGSHPQRVFDRAAVKAAFQFKFKPQITNGVAEEVKATQTIEFVIPQQIDPSLNDLPLQLPSMTFEDKNGTDNVLPKDITTLIKSIAVKSKTKTHKRSLKEFKAKIIPDQSGRPSEVKVIKNTYGSFIDQQKIQTLLDGALFRAQVSHAKFSGYYDPVFSMPTAKTQPASIVPVFEAKSMPVPEFALEFKLFAQVVVDERGDVIEVKDSKIEKSPVDEHLTLTLLKDLKFYPAQKKYQPIKDTVDLAITFAVVQKADIYDIKRSMGLE